MTGPASVIAIDGPAGSGKSTLARRLARTLGLPYVNTGLMYRAVTLEARRRGIDPADGPGLAVLASTLRFDLDHSASPPELTIDGRPPPSELTSPDVESSVSAVSRHPQVRAVLRTEQRRLCAGGGVVEGRDIGTVVAPDAVAKIFLLAEAAARIDRRSSERGSPADDVAEALSTRDALDARTNPLEPAPDAVPIDTTTMGPDEVFAAALVVVRRALDSADGRDRGERA